MFAAYINQGTMKWLVNRFQTKKEAIKSLNKGLVEARKKKAEWTFVQASKFEVVDLTGKEKKLFADVMLPSFKLEMMLELD